METSQSDINRFHSKYSISSDGCWEWQGSLNFKGYGWFRVQGRTWKAHRFSYTVFHGDIPKGVHIMHLCDNPGCVNPDHLKPGTNADNVSDRQAKGRGRWDHLTKTDEATVIRVREMRANGAKHSDIAEAVGLEVHHVSDICQRRTWKHV